MKKNYVLYYDLIKIIATFMVCLYHLGVLDVGIVTDTFYIPNFNKLILNLCAMSVPLFFMVNGALMLRRRYSYGEVVKRFFKLVLLYAFWVVIIGEIGELFFQIKNITFIEILKGQRNTISVHLWFLRTLAILTLLLPIFSRIYEAKYKKVLYGLMALIFVFPFLYNSIVLIGKWFDIEGINNLSITGVFTLYSILYFLLGKIISDESAKETTTNKKRKIYAWTSVIVGWMFISIEVMLWSNLNRKVYDGVNSCFPTIGALLMAVGIFYLLSKVKMNQEQRIAQIVKKISENIMGVYIFHIVVIFAVKKVLHASGTLINSIAMTIFIIVIALVVTILLKKLPGVRKLLNI